MKSETIAVQQLFQERRQYRVPFYQRAYVWGREEQWEPLWKDIEAKAEARQSGDNPPAHFLGAIVLEPQQRRGLLGVDAFHIIDGQQRLTTLQYFLSALAMAAREGGASPTLTFLETCLWNPNPDTMERPEVEGFKVWPTFRDRAAYEMAMLAKNADELRARFPMSFTRDGALRKIGMDHPPSLEAIWYFLEQIEAWILAPNGSATDRGALLESLTLAALRDLRVVSISLGEDDDAQVIFETLNGRGAELSATDLIRNFVFMRADAENADSAALYDSYWTPFESTFWSDEQRRGRLRRPRLEWFFQTALQASLADDVEIGRLYQSYRRFALPPTGHVTADAQLRMLSDYSESYRSMLTGSGEEPIGKFGKRIAVWDVSPSHALALRVASIGLPPQDQERILGDVISYVVRRAICGLLPKNYNKIFLQLLRSLSGAGKDPGTFRASLAALKGDSSRWPRDDEFKRAWLTVPVHRNLGEPARVRSVLTDVENGLRTPYSEEPYVPSLGTLDVDHIMPDKWYDRWPLDGEFVTQQEATAAVFSWSTPENEDPKTQRIARRERLKATIGNLTLIHYGVNRSLQNGPFEEKRVRLFADSNLHLNRSLMVATKWDEESIEERGSALFEVARRLWPGPDQP
jgi:hypothetical protein